MKSGKKWEKVGKKVCTEQTRCHHGGARSLHEEHRGSKEITRRCNSVVILTNSLAYQRIFSHHEMHTRSPRKCPEMQGANKEIARWYTVIVRHSTVHHGVLHFRLRVAIAQPFRDSVTRALGTGTRRVIKIYIRKTRLELIKISIMSPAKGLLGKWKLLFHYYDKWLFMTCNAMGLQ